MSSHNHTEGPWIERRNDKSFYPTSQIYGLDGRDNQVLVAEGIHHFEDAKLIAAAPVLLQALEDIDKQCAYDEDTPLDDLRANLDYARDTAARMAAKARGQE